MKLDARAMAVTLGLLWGGALLVVGLANLAWDGYGDGVLSVMASVYPGYQAGTGSLGQALVGAGYALLDGAIGGALLAWIYNLFARA